MKKKRLISLMLAGMMTTGVGAMAGCSCGSKDKNNPLDKVPGQELYDDMCLGSVRK